MSTFNALNSLKQVVTQVSVVSIVAIGTVTLAHPAQAISLNLRTWIRYGDVQATPTQAELTNAYGDGLDDAVNRNLSGSDPLSINDLESFLALPSESLGLDAVEGSAIRTIFNNVKVGDRLSFNWSLPTFDALNPDRAFVAINNTIFNLAGANPFSYTFTGAGTYNVAIGVVDVNEAINSSRLTVSNANFTPVPTPALLPGMIGLGWRVLSRRRRAQ
jgi:hypothetical protein